MDLGKSSAIRKSVEYLLRPRGTHAKTCTPASASNAKRISSSSSFNQATLPIELRHDISSRIIFQLAGWVKKY